MAIWNKTQRGNQTTFGDLDNTIIGNLGNDSLLNGRLVGDWANSDLVGDVWSKLTRN